MKIFGFIINGKEADDFMKLSCAKKKEWIKANTNQTHDVLIEAFVKNVSRGSDDNECAGCKEEKNVPKTISEETPAAIEPAIIAKNSSKRNRPV